MLRINVLAAALIVLITLSSCGLQEISREGEGHRPDRLLNVPFYPQTDYQCGPSSLSSIYAYWGSPVAPSVIASELKSNTHRGTLTIDLYIHAKKRGYRVSQSEGTLKELVGLIKQGIPVIVMLDRGIGFFQKNHFVVLVGYNSKGVFAHDGQEKNRFIPVDEFKKQWQRAGNWMLVIRPR